MFIKTEGTPNPRSLKFTPEDKPLLFVAGEGGEADAPDSDGEGSDDGDYYDDEDDMSATRGYHISKGDMSLVKQSPLASALFSSIPSVQSVYITNDFVTVTNEEGAEEGGDGWDVVKPRVFQVLMDYLSSDGYQPAVSPTTGDSESDDDDGGGGDDDDEITLMIKELLHHRIRPAIQSDGGDISLHSFDEASGEVRVKLEGSCVGCPSSSVTLKAGVENMLRHYIPEVTSVVDVDQEGEPTGSGGLVGENVKIDRVDSKIEEDDGKPKMTYEDRMRAAGVPFD